MHHILEKMHQKNCPALIILVGNSNVSRNVFHPLLSINLYAILLYFLPFILPVIRCRAASNSSSDGSAAGFFPFLSFSLPEYFASKAAARECIEFLWFWRLDIKATKVPASDPSDFLFFLYNILGHYSVMYSRNNIRECTKKVLWRTMISLINKHITSLVYGLQMV